MWAYNSNINHCNVALGALLSYILSTHAFLQMKSRSISSLTTLVRKNQAHLSIVEKLKSRKANNYCLVNCMPYYILLSNLTDEGWKTVKTKPERIKEVNRELEAFGVRVIHQYAVLGPYDFVNIVEAPNNETIAKVSIELGFRGTIKILSMPAIPIDEFIASVKKR